MGVLPRSAAAICRQGPDVISPLPLRGAAALEMPLFRSTRVAPARWQASKSDQALEFLNIACADAAAPPIPSSPAPPQTPMPVAPAPPKERPQMLALQGATKRISRSSAAVQSLRKRSFSFNVVGSSWVQVAGGGSGFRAALARWADAAKHTEEAIGVAAAKCPESAHQVGLHACP